jgi:hypothetical protein
MLNFYTNHVTRVSWNGICSDAFSVKNGVKQGGVISPVLFCIYVDGLLLSLKNSGFGCVIGRMFLGALAYADDIVLLAPTPRAMRSMLAVCDDFASKFQIVFNAKKSKCLYFAPHAKQCRSQGPLPLFSVGGQLVEYVDEWPHLGHIISSNFDDKTEILSKRGKLCGQINNVLCYFARRDPITKLRLMKSYCTSFYGSVLWDLAHPSVEDVCIVWRKGLRRVWDLPHNSHSVLLPPLCTMLPLFDELCCRCAGFINNCVNSDCDIVSFVARHGIFHARMLSPIGRNAMRCCFRYNVKLDSIGSLSKSFVQSFVNSTYTVDIINTVLLLLELLLVKFKFYTLTFWSNSEITEFIALLSTM